MSYDRRVIIIEVKKERAVVTMAGRIDRNMTVKEVLEQYQETAKVFQK
jgi:hypothetical protein